MDHFCILKFVENLLHMVQMVLCGFTVDDYVIYVGNNEWQVLNYLTQQLLEVCRCFCQSKRHFQVLLLDK